MLCVLRAAVQILHVSGLMESVTREQLRELFSQAGEVTKVDIPDGGRSMVSRSGVQEALFGCSPHCLGMQYEGSSALIACLGRCSGFRCRRQGV
jgi:hypothetical protein